MINFNVAVEIEIKNWDENVISDTKLLRCPNFRVYKVFSGHCTIIYLRTIHDIDIHVMKINYL
jgi:hypothetical protein